MIKYELALVVSAKVEDNVRAEIVEKAKAYVTRYEGVIGQVEEWGKRRLAYEIAHQREGYYYFIHFEAEPTAPSEIESHVRIMDNVLRYLIVRTDSDEIIAPAPEPEFTEEAPAAEEAAKAPVVEEVAEEAPVEEEVAEEAPAEEAPATEE